MSVNAVTRIIWGITEQNARQTVRWMDSRETRSSVKETLIYSAAHLAMPFPSCELANFLTCLAVSQEICSMRMAEKAPSDVPPYCAVLP